MKLTPLEEIRHEELKDVPYDKIRALVKTSSCQAFLKYYTQNLREEMGRKESRAQGRLLIKVYYYYYLIGTIVGLILWTAYIHLLKEAFR